MSPYAISYCYFCWFVSHLPLVSRLLICSERLPSQPKKKSHHYREKFLSSNEIRTQKHEPHTNLKWNLLTKQENRLRIHFSWNALYTQYTHIQQTHLPMPSRIVLWFVYYIDKSTLAEYSKHWLVERDGMKMGFQNSSSSEQSKHATWLLHGAFFSFFFPFQLNVFHVFLLC